MSAFKDDPLRFSRSFLTFIGLWHTQSKTRRWIGLVAFVLGYLSIITPQVFTCDILDF